jgi:hypothetical protein
MMQNSGESRRETMKPCLYAVIARSASSDAIQSRVWDAGLLCFARNGGGGCELARVRCCREFIRVAPLAGRKRGDARSIRGA